MEDKFEELLDQAYIAPNGRVKIGLLEEAIRFADIHLGVDEQFEARMALVDTAIFSGHGEKAIVAFAWCLAQYDKDPNIWNEHQMMWNYKWVVDRLLMFPDIELAKVEEMMEDLKKRFIQTGHGPHFYYFMKQELAMLLEKPEEVEHYYAKWIKEPSDSLSDCHACTLANQTKTLLHLGKLEEALAVAQPILEGRASCHSVPHRTYGDLLVPLLHADRKAEADDYFQKGYELVYNQAGLLEIVIQLFRYATITNTSKAISLFEKYIPEALDSDESLNKYNFYSVATAFWDILDNQDKKAIQLPGNTKIEDIKKENARLAHLFDKQNQTDVYTKRIDRVQSEIYELRKTFVQP
jgi:tetratricopeptide (TPR) repeat protein